MQNNVQYFQYSDVKDSNQVKWAGEDIFLVYYTFINIIF